MKAKIKIPKNSATTKVVSEIDQEYVKDLGMNYEVVCFDDDDIYKLGYEVAKEMYEEKPEEFFIKTDWVPFLKQAISHYERDQRVQVVSFKINNKDEDGFTKVTVLPTKGYVLFHIYAVCGALFERNASGD